MGEDAVALAGRVRVEVDQDVDPVVPDHLPSELDQRVSDLTLQGYLSSAIPTILGAHQAGSKRASEGGQGGG